MAIYTDTLGYISDRRQIPYRSVSKVMTGADLWYIYPGRYLQEIDAVYEVIGGYYQYVASGDAANRYAKIIQYSIGQTICQIQSEVIVASETHDGLIMPFSAQQEFCTWAEQYIGINKEFMTVAGTNDYIRVSATNGLAADSFIVKLNFKFKNWELGMSDYTWFDKLRSMQQ